MKIAMITKTTKTVMLMVKKYKQKEDQENCPKDNLKDNHKENYKDNQKGKKKYFFSSPFILSSSLLCVGASLHTPREVKQPLFSVFFFLLMFTFFKVKLCSFASL